MMVLGGVAFSYERGTPVHTAIPPSRLQTPWIEETMAPISSQWLQRVQGMDDEQIKTMITKENYDRYPKTLYDEQIKGLGYRS